MANAWKRSVRRLRSVGAVGLVAATPVLPVGLETPFSAAPAPVATPSPEQAAGAARAEADARAAARERRTPEARERRERSRRAYAGLGDERALSVNRRAHPDILDRRLWRAPKLPSGAEVRRYVEDDHAAIVEQPGQKGGVVVRSALPLRVRDAEGTKAPISTELRQRGTGFAPRNALADIRLAPTADGGVHVPAVDVGVAPAVDGSGTAEVLGDKLHWSNVAPDTDYVVAALPTGFETFHLLRSATAPERHPLDVDLPPGARIERSAGAPGSLEVVKGGKTLMTISAPQAADADGADVPVRYELAGDRIVLAVDHRSADVAYPIAVDPVFAVNRLYWKYNASISWSDWGSGQQGGSPIHFMQSDGTGPWSRGLFVWLQGGYWYNHLDTGMYFTQAPGDTYIQRADFGAIDYIDQGGGACVSAGLWNARGHADFRWEPQVWDSPGIVIGAPGYWTHCTGQGTRRDLYISARLNGQPTRGNAALFQMFVNGSGHRTIGDMASLGGSYTEVVDDTGPKGHFINLLPGGWTRATSLNLGLHAFDEGFGTMSIGLFDGPSQVTGYTNPCTFVYPRMCPREIAYPFTLPVGFEGIKQYRLLSDDALATRTESPWLLKADRTGPALAASGSLWDARGATVTAGAKTLTVQATDGVQGGTLAQRRSGVARMEVRLFAPGGPAGGTLVKPAQTSVCANAGTNSDSCPMTETYTFANDSSQTPGTYRVVVTAIDGAGNTATPVDVTFTKPDGIPPTTPVLAHGKALPTGWTDRHESTVTGTSTDVDSGLKEFRFFRRGSATETPVVDPVEVLSTTTACDGSAARPCPRTPTTSEALAYDTDELPEGIVNPYLVAADVSGNSSAEAWFGLASGGGLKIDRSPPEVRVRAGATQLDSGHVFTDPAQQQTLTIEATEGSQASDLARRSGVDSVTLELAEDVGYGETDPEFVAIDPAQAGNTCTQPDSCGQSRQLDIGELDEGLHRLRIVAKDELADDEGVPAADHTTSLEFVFYIDDAAPTLDPATIDTSRELTDWFNDDVVTISGALADAGTGVHRARAEYPPAPDKPGVAEQVRPVFGGIDPCGVSANPATRCPETVAADPANHLVMLNTSHLAEGSAVPVSLTARDGVDRASAPHQLVFKVDRTPPQFPEGGEIRVTAEAGATEGVVSWDAADDPSLTDASPGSGLARYDYVVRDGGTVLAQGEAPGDEVTVPGLQADQAVTVDVTAVDVAGNRSATLTATVQASEPVDCATTYCTPPSDPKVMTGEDPDTLIDDGTGDDGQCAPAATYCGEDDVDPDITAPGALQRAAQRAGLAGRSPWPWGLSDQNDVTPNNVFTDARFGNLSITTARLVVPWDTALPSGSHNLPKTKRWVAAAQAANKRVLISFERCRNAEDKTDPGNPYKNCKTVPPTLDQYALGVDAFLKVPEFSGIRDFTAWNEPNNSGYQPTGHLMHAGLAGAYWRRLGEVCRALGRTCNVAAGDFLDSKMQNPNGLDRRNGEVSWGKRYFDAYRVGMAYQPCVWAWHPYTDTERALEAELPWRSLRSFRAATQTTGNNPRTCGSGTTLSDRSPSIWITEAGALVEQNRDADPTVIEIDHTPAEQARAVEKLVTTLPDVSERIKRLYYYHWHGAPDTDAGLLYRNPCGTCGANPGWERYRARPAYTVFREATD